MPVSSSATWQTKTDTIGLPFNQLEEFGKNMTVQDFGATAAQFYDIKYLGNGIVLAGGGGDTPDRAIYRSEDYGSSWTRIAHGGTTVLSICNVGRGIVLCGDAGGDIFRSTDYGLTWTSVYTGTQAGIYAIEYCRNGVVLAGSDGGFLAVDGEVLRSTDSGATWSVLISNTGACTALKYLGNGIVVRGDTEAGGVGIQLFQSTDDGATWTDKTSVPVGYRQINTMEHLGNGLVLAGTGLNNTDTGRILRSTDYGNSWSDSLIASGVTGVNSIKYLGNGIVLAGTGYASSTGDLYQSTDYGVTWTLINTFTADIERVGAVEFIPEGKLLIGTGSGAGDGDLYTQDITDFFPNREQVNNQTGTSYTLVLTDRLRKTVYMNNAGANTITVPPNTDVAFPIGSVVDVVMEGSGVTTITAGAGVTLNGTLVMSQYERKTLTKRATDTWIVT